MNILNKRRCKCVILMVLFYGVLAIILSFAPRSDAKPLLNESQRIPFILSASIILASASVPAMPAIATAVIIEKMIRSDSKSAPRHKRHTRSGR